MQEPLERVQALKVADGRPEPATRVIPEETPVALVYDGTTHAVMMATPADLEDFAIGFSIGEGKITSADEIHELSIIEQADGIELRMWLKPDAGRRIAVRRRALLGPTGCGLCGVESLAAALPTLPQVARGRSFSAEDVTSAVASLMAAQSLNRQARALHAAAFWGPEKGLIALREDVGRHNALDKLAGAMTRAGLDPTSGIVVLTSRVSVEMVQKAAALGAPVITAVSAPTALALKSAESAGITLIAIARADGFEIFTNPHRLSLGTSTESRFRRECLAHAAC